MDPERKDEQTNHPPPPPPPISGLPSSIARSAQPDEPNVLGAGQRATQVQKELQFLLVGAIEQQQPDKIKSLVAQGVNLDCTILYSKTPLTHAIELTFVEVAKLMVSSGASVNKPELLAHAQRPLHLALNIHAHDLMQFLIQHGAEVDGRDGCGATALHQACFAGDTDAVEILLSAGASVKVADSVGRTALHRAVEGQHFDLADYLLTCGADINERDNFGWTPLYQSIVFCDLFAITFLLSHGADVNNIDYKRDTPVHIACDRLCRGNIYAILSTSLDFYKRVKKIPTPALQSLLLGERDCIHCEFRVIRELVNAGADLRNIPLKTLVSRQNNLHRFLPALQYLILSGLMVQSTDLDLNAFCYPQFEKFCVWLGEQVDYQMSLQRLCRRAVRSILSAHHRDVEKSVWLLPLPQKVRHFLNLSDFWQSVTQEAFGDGTLCCMSMYHWQHSK